MNAGDGIRWFNPRQTDDAMVRALATGRATLLANFMKTVHTRLQHPGGDKHWLVTGTRGAGKSYFLRMAQVQLADSALHSRVRCVLLPEELPNVQAPHQLLDEIQRLLKPQDHPQGRAAAWRVVDAVKAWKASLAALLSSFTQDLLVVGIENLQELLEGAFASEEQASLLRTLMAHEPRLLLLATAVNGAVDEQYNKRLFSQFEHHALVPWDAPDHQRYLAARAVQTGHWVTRHQLARIDAYSRFTGGNARIAAIFADVILQASNSPSDAAARGKRPAKVEQQQAIGDAGAEFNRALDVLSDYYRAQLKDLGRAASHVLDALLRGGEPCTQQELTERIQATQSDVAQAFRALVNAGHLWGEREPGEARTRYRLADRLFAQWYRMRYLEPDNRSQLAVMADLIADTVAHRDKWRYARDMHASGKADDAQVYLDSAVREVGIEPNLLREQGFGLDDVIRVSHWMGEPSKKSGSFKGREMVRWIDYVERWPNDRDMAAAFADATALVGVKKKINSEGVNGKQLAAAVMSSLALSPVEKLQVLQVLQFSVRAECTYWQWTGLMESFDEEASALKKPMPTEDAEVAALIARVELSAQYPWTVNWMYWIDKLAMKGGMNDRWSNLDRDLLTAALATAALSSARKANLLQHDVVIQGDLLRQLEKSTGKLIWDHHLPALCALLLEPLLRAWPDDENVQSQTVQAAALTQLGVAQLVAQATVSAEAHLNKALSLWMRLDHDRGHAQVANGKSWISGSGGRFHEARDWAWTAYQQYKIAEDPGQAAWALGQAARYTVLLDGFAGATALVESESLTWTIERRIATWQQLADAVHDLEKSGDLGASFALGRRLLAHLAAQAELPFERVLRAITLDWLEMGVSLQLIRELLDEVPTLLTPDAFAPIAASHGLLCDWLADLARAPDEREQARKRFNPDLALTLATLEKELGIKTRMRLGLAQQPQPTAEALALFHRIVALLC